MRKIINLNNCWYYKPEYKPGWERQNTVEGFSKVNLPHTNVELPYNYFDEQAYQFQSCYKYQLSLAQEYRNKVLYLHFAGVMALARVYLNGVFVGEHKGGYTPFALRIDQACRFGAENMLTVMVNSAELKDIPPFGGQIDYLTYGGIYREVYLGIYDSLFIKNIKVEPGDILSVEKSLQVKIFLENTRRVKGNGSLQITLREKNGRPVYVQSANIRIEPDQKQYDFGMTGLKKIKLWSTDRPNLYEITVGLKINECQDEYTDCFGFRKAEFTKDGFYLNGEKLKITGLNRHQSYPYVGYAMPRRIQEKDAKILKNELHVNMVRTSHYPQSTQFLNKCDELGLLVFEEIPGWHHIGDEQWQKTAKENLREMMERDWNHPSIVLWGVRINESEDDDEFYTETNRIAGELDPTRQTGGVRYITRSNFLEDVYTFNDFIYDGKQKPLRRQEEVTGLTHKVPYLVTEFMGHMYPTKRFDQEERQIEQSLRYLQILNAAGLDDSISGTIGWCAFDYNTHKDFGSGDRICYHGVMDMFRLPKFAANVYRSQVSPEIEPILEPVTFWARGERDACRVMPVVILTNCDYLTFQFGREMINKKIYPRKDEYRGIAYPPVIIDYSVINPKTTGAWGMMWQDAVFTGYYQDKPVIQRKFAGNPLPSELFAAADDLALDASQKDATRIVVKVLDQYKNLLPFLDEIIKLKLYGPGRLQGPEEVALKGGAVAFWVETINEPGIIAVSIRSRSLGEKIVKLTVK